MAGGKRPGAGRKPGAKNKRTIEREQKTAAFVEKLGEILDVKPFDGDAHGFLISVYKDPTKDLDARLDAAKAAAPYEKPKLAAVTLSGDEEAPIVVDDKTRARALAALLARLKAEKAPE